MNNEHLLSMPSGYLKDSYTDIDLALYPGHGGGGGKAAWYLMFAHAPKLQRKLVIVYSS